MKRMGSQVIMPFSTWYQATASVRMPGSMARSARGRTRVLTPSSGGGGALRAQDLGERRAADLQLALVGLARADEPLDLEAGALQRARQRRAGVALRPREDLHGGRRGGERHRAARHGS